MKDEEIGTARRIALWAGIGGIILGWLLMRHLFAEQPELGPVTIYALGTVPPFACWAVALGLAQVFAKRRAGR